MKNRICIGVILLLSSWGDYCLRNLRFFFLNQYSDGELQTKSWKLEFLNTALFLCSPITWIRCLIPLNFGSHILLMRKLDLESLRFLSDIRSPIVVIHFTLRNSESVSTIESHSAQCWKTENITITSSLTMKIYNLMKG